MCADRDEEYRALEDDARAFIARRSAAAAPDDAFAARLQIDKELLALQRRFRKIRSRDYRSCTISGVAAAVWPSLRRCSAPMSADGPNDGH
jgi:hypothetical protein